MIEALIFDMDGLLFDTERIVQRSWDDCGRKLGLGKLGEHIYSTLGMNAAGREIYFKKAVGENFPYEEFAEFTRIRFQEIICKEGIPVKPGVRQLLTYARERELKVALATSTRREHAMRNLEDAQIDGYFHELVFGDMVKRCKPDPEIYVMAGLRLGVEPARCLALEDAPNGVRSAYAAGMLPVMVPDLVKPDEEIKRLAYRVCDSLFEVIDLLIELKKDRIP